LKSFYSISWNFSGRVWQVGGFGLIKFAWTVEFKLLFSFKYVKTGKVFLMALEKFTFKMDNGFSSFSSLIAKDYFQNSHNRFLRGGYLKR